jgi:hypothetical protein
MRQKGNNMQTKQTIEISVRSFFTGMKSAEQVFVDLIRRRIATRSVISFEPSNEGDYSDNNVVFPGVHAHEREMVI